MGWFVGFVLRGRFGLPRHFVGKLTADVHGKALIFHQKHEFVSIRSHFNQLLIYMDIHKVSIENRWAKIWDRRTDHIAARLKSSHPSRPSLPFLAEELVFLHSQHRK